MSLARLEFDVQLTCESCCRAVKKALDGVEGVTSVTIDLQSQSVVVEASVPSSVIQETIESTNRKAILKGIGATIGSQHLGAGVAALTGSNNVYGIVRFLQIDQKTCVIDGTIDGLEVGEHGIHVHEFGDLSKGCNSLGNHYNPTNLNHGCPTGDNKHVGDLGNVLANTNGRATFRMESDAIKVWDMIGRSFAVSAHRDDLGEGKHDQSKVDGNSGPNIACGIIARSAGLFENTKRICSCSGQTIWEERDDAIKAAKI